LDFRTEDSLFVKNTFRWYLNEVLHAIRSGNWDTADNVLNVIKAHQLEYCNGNLINLNRIQAEIRYNQIDFFNRSRPAYFLLGGLLLIIAFLRLIRERKWLRNLSLAFTVGIVLVFLFHAFGMGMRWFVSGHAPWSNSYESMVYVAWISVLVGFIFGRKNDMMIALGTLFGGVVLFVASLNWMNPQITTLVPVLRSPWLIYHVATNVAAYGFFGISFLLGIINMSIMAFAKNSSLAQERFRELTIINNMSLLIGLALMTIGAFIGGVWANESWGRYWGWDPKETWALVTIVVYTIVTHLYLIKQWYNDWLLNLLSSLAFSTVLMTYFGVNHFLAGLHSYGHTVDNIHVVVIYIGLAFVAVGVLGVISYRNRNVGKKEKNSIPL
jgi:cytochrome c-type biogenesis protein CcsB